MSGSRLHYLLLFIRPGVMQSSTKIQLRNFAIQFHTPLSLVQDRQLTGACCQNTWLFQGMVQSQVVVVVVVVVVVIIADVVVVVVIAVVDDEDDDVYSFYNGSLENQNVSH